MIDGRYRDAARRVLAGRRTAPAYRTVAVVVTGRLVWLIIERVPR